MNRSKLLRVALLFLIAATLALAPTAIVSAGRPPANGVHISPIGRPTWKPADFHLFAAPIGTAQDGYAEFFATMGQILPPPYHVHNTYLDPGGIGPGAPHQPPYIYEIGSGVAALGFHQGIQFSTAEFSNGVGVDIAWMTVASPTNSGSSPDFASGPIMPNSLFPLIITGVTYHNGELTNPYLAYVTVPKLDDMGFPGLDGHSHFPMWIGDNADFLPPGYPVEGSYLYSLDMVDASGSGWHIDVNFTVVP